MVEQVALPSFVASSVDSYALLGVAAILAVALAVLVHSRPKVGVIIWLLVIAFVPVWLGAKFVVYFYPASIAGLFILVAVVPGWPRRWGIGDLIAGFFVLACLAPVVVGGSSKTSIFVVLSQWLLAYLLGRTLSHKVGLSWMYRGVSVVFCVVSVLAIAEFLFSWNPFVQIHVSNALFSSWSPLQERGGLLRAEGAFGHSIALGASIALIIPIVLASDFRLRIRVVISGVMVGAAVVTFSRVAMLCAALAVVISVLFLRDGISRRVRVTVVAIMVVLGVVLIPFVSSVFDAAGSEATNSASYRGNLLSLLPQMSIVGYAPITYKAPNGDLFFGRFQSIDSQLILTGLTYGWLALAFAVVGLVFAVAVVVARRATSPTVALVAQIPALATVALITQYAMVVWFIIGLAVVSQIEAKPLVPADADRLVQRATAGRFGHEPVDAG